jgi:hypothetical protein
MAEGGSGRGSARLKSFSNAVSSLAAIFLTLVVASAQQEPLPSPLTLRQAVTIALEKKPLRTGRGLVPLVRHAAGHHGADPADAGWHSARARLDGSILYCHLDDRLHRRSRNHRAQFHHSGRSH